MMDFGVFSGKKICVAISGGMDSVALLHYMQKQAEETAARSYAQTLAKAQADAREYCRKILSETDAVVGKIVGRIISGDC